MGNKLVRKTNKRRGKYQAEEEKQRMWLIKGQYKRHHSKKIRGLLHLW